MDAARRPRLRAGPLGGLILVPARVAGLAARRWPQRPSAGLLAGAVLDETVLALANHAGRYPDDGEAQRVAAELAAAADLHRERGFLADPTRYHRVPPPLVAPDIRRVRTVRARHEWLSWESGYEPWPGEPGREAWLDHVGNRTAHAWVLRHGDDAPRPWVVCLHGLGSGTATADLFGFQTRTLHQLHGLNVLLPVLPLHGPRRTGRMSGADFLTYDLARAILAIAQAVWDVRRAIGWARAAGATRIAVHGVSLGAYVAALLATLDDDLDTVVAGVPVVDIPGMFAAHAPRSQRRRGRRLGLLGEAVEVAHTPVSPLAAPPKLPPEALFLYAGGGDRLVPPDQAERLWDHWGGPRALWYGGGHLGFLLSRPVREFVDGALRDRGLITGQGQA